MAAPRDISDQIVKDLVDPAGAGSIRTYGPNGARSYNKAADFLVVGLLMGGLAAEGGAAVAFGQFHDGSACFTVSVSGDLEVPPGATHRYTLTVHPVRGGALVSPVTFTGSPGSVAPINTTVHDDAPLSFSYTAPTTTSKHEADWAAEGVSKRGHFRESVTFGLQPAYLLTWSAELSGSTSWHAVDPLSDLHVDENLDEAVSGTAALVGAQPGGSGDVSWTNTSYHRHEVGQVVCAVCGDNSWHDWDGTLTALSGDPATFEAALTPGSDPQQPFAGAHLRLTSEQLQLLVEGSGSIFPGPYHHVADLDAAVAEADADLTGFTAGDTSDVLATLSITRTDLDNNPGMTLTEHFTFRAAPTS